MIPPNRQRMGGAVKAGPLGPPGGGAPLTAPGVQLSPATLGSDRPSGGPGCSGGGWAQRTSPLLNILSGATEMLGDRPFLRDVFAWCVPATVRTDSLK